MFYNDYFDKLIATLPMINTIFLTIKLTIKSIKLIYITKYKHSSLIKSKDSTKAKKKLGPIFIRIFDIFR